MDPMTHPDLASLGHQLRNRLHETLDAEQYAARAAAIRRRTLRDVLLLLEDRGEPVVVRLSDGSTEVGQLQGVGPDVVEIGDSVFVTTASIISIRPA